MAIKTTGVRFDLIAKDSASKVFDTVGKRAGTLDSSLGKTLKTAAKFGGVLAGAVAGGLAKAASDAVKFQTEMTKVQTQAGSSAKDVQALSKQVLGLAKSTEQGPQELAEALYHLKSVGMDNAAAMKSLKVASDLAAVGGSGLEDTTNALAGAWRSGIKGADTFSKAASTVNAVLGAGNMRMQDFVDAIGTGILPSAKSFGLSLNQVGAALALMTDEGVPATDAATRLRMSFSLLGAPSAAADKQLKKIGLTGLDLAQAMRGPDGLIGAVQLLKDHLDKSGLSAAQTSQLLSRAFGGGKSDSAILTMLNNLGVLKQKQDQVNSSMGKFPAAVAAQRKTIQAQYDIIKSNLESASITIGTKLLPPLSKFVQYLTKTALPEVGKFSSHLRSMVPVKQIEGDFKSAVGFVSDFITGLKGPKKVAVTPEWDTSKPFPVNEGMIPSVPKQKAPLPFPITEGLIPSTSEQKKTVSQGQQLGDQLRTALTGGLNDAVSGLDWNKLGKQLGAGLDVAFGWVAGHSKQLGGKISKAIQSIDWAQVGKTLGKTAVPFMVGFTDDLFTPLFTKDFWKKHWWDTLIAAISVIPVDEAFGAARAGVAKIPWGKLGDAIGDGLAKIPWGKSLNWAKWLGRTGADAYAAVSQIAAGIFREFTSAFSSKFPRLGQWFYEQLLLLPVRIGDMGRSMRTAFSKAMDSLVKSVPGLSNRFVRAFLKWLGRYTFYQTGTNLIVGLYNGITAKLAGAGKWVKSHVVDPVVDWVKSLFGIHSPSTVFAGIGSNLIAGLYSGITGKLAGIGKWANSHIKSPIVHAIVKPSSWLRGSGGSIMSGLVSGSWAWLSKKGNDFGTWARKIKSKIVSAVVDVFKIGSPSKVMMEYGGWIMAGLSHGMLQSKDALKTVAKEAFKTPLDAAEALYANGVQLPASWLAKVGGSLFANTLKGSLGSNQKLGQKMMAVAGFQAGDWPALDQLWIRESGWRTNATNPTSGAYGIPQALPPSKMASAGPDWRTSAATQIAWGLDYIRSRYGTPRYAWAHEQEFGWYAKGGLARPGMVAWVGENGPELMRVSAAGARIYSNRQSMAMARARNIPTPRGGQGGAGGGTVIVRPGDTHVHVHFDDEALRDLIDVQVRDGVEAGHDELLAAARNTGGW